MPIRAAILLHQSRRALAGEDRCQAVGLGERRPPPGRAASISLAHRAVEQGRLGQRPGHQGVLGQAPHALSRFEHRDLADPPGAHQVERLAHRRRGGHAHQRGRVGRPALQQLLDRDPGRVEQLVLLHPLVVEDLGEVALAGVAQDGDHAGGGVVQLPGHLQRQSHVEPRRSADQDPLLPRQPPGHREGVAVGHLAELVDVIEPDGARGSCRPRSPPPCRGSPRPGSGSWRSRYTASPAGRRR